jgi:hypothetical protein
MVIDISKLKSKRKAIAMTGAAIRVVTLKIKI